jgi:hypothetical protein
LYLRALLLTNPAKIRAQVFFRLALETLVIYVSLSETDFHICVRGGGWIPQKIRAWSLSILYIVIDYKQDKNNPNENKLPNEKQILPRCV